MRFFFLLLSLLGARSAEAVLKCWECSSPSTTKSPFDCDPENGGHSVECYSLLGRGLEGVCATWINEKQVKKFCTWLPEVMMGGETEKCDVHFKDNSKTLCWCKSGDNCNQKGILNQGATGQPACPSGAESASSSQSLLVLLTIGIISFRFGKLLPCVLLGLVALSAFPFGAEALQCKAGQGTSTFPIPCDEQFPFCFLQMTETDSEPKYAYGCLSETMASPDIFPHLSNGLCGVDAISDKNIIVYCICNDKDNCNEDPINGVGLRTAPKSC
ncbi:hypothetical protein Ocin01_13740 [Orchesella cincta]|uniref:Uncharacterized protein n=1 Tax=Orchesella cincta TaxID=48709 RepID=A0A1D2MJ41_ORCCI|nr:hypothetical protein Ocin01_13740 [Orchesella cincta]